MSFTAIFQQAAVTAREIFGAGTAGDIFKPCTYQPCPDSIDIDPGSGKPVWEGIPTVSVLVCLVDYTAFGQQNTAILAVDQKGLIAALDMPATTPKNGDLLRLTGETDVWEVIGVGIDPAGALWILHLRPYGNGWPLEWF